MRIVYTAASGKSIDLSRGLIRAVSVSGIFPERTLNVEENGTAGGSVISERRGTRNITVRAALCGDIGRSQAVLSGRSSAFPEWDGCCFRTAAKLRR